MPTRLGGHDSTRYEEEEEDIIGAGGGGGPRTILAKEELWTILAILHLLLLLHLLQCKHPPLPIPL